MKNYQDAWLLGSPFKLIASWHDSFVFVDGENPEVILKLYESLTRDELIRYYELHKKHARKWVMQLDDVHLEVLDPKIKPEQHIIDNEDGILVVLPRINGINLTRYGTAEERMRILWQIKKIAKRHNLPITGWYEIKFENLTITKQYEDGAIHVVMTDIAARIDECLGVTKK